MNQNGQAFLLQNEMAAATLTLDEVAPYAEHHSGGLIVLAGSAADGRSVKMHDSWGDDGSVIVHAYDPAEAEDPSETVDEFATGSAALDRFLEMIGGRRHDWTHHEDGDDEWWECSDCHATRDADHFQKLIAGN